MGVSQHHHVSDGGLATSSAHYTQLPDTEAHDIAVTYPGVESVEVVQPSVNDLIFTLNQVVSLSPQFNSHINPSRKYWLISSNNLD